MTLSKVRATSSSDWRVRGHMVGVPVDPELKCMKLEVNTPSQHLSFNGNREK
jgi:hypothetical protein